MNATSLAPPPPSPTRPPARACPRAPTPCLVTTAPQVWEKPFPSFVDDTMQLSIAETLVSTGRFDLVIGPSHTPAASASSPTPSLGSTHGAPEAPPSMGAKLGETEPPDQTVEGELHVTISKV